MAKGKKISKQEFIDKLNSLPKEEQYEVRMRLAIEKKQQELIANQKDKQLNFQDKVNASLKLAALVKKANEEADKNKDKFS